jgi:hypothetical protein
LREFACPARGPYVAVSLFGLLDAARGPARVTESVLAIHASSRIRARVHLHVKRQLVVQVALDLLSAADRK